MMKLSYIRILGWCLYPSIQVRVGSAVGSQRILILMMLASVCIAGFGALVGGGHERIMDVLRNKGIIDKECSGHGISASQLEDEEHSDEEDAQLSNETRLLKSVRQTMLPLLQVKQCLKIDIPFAGLGWTHRM